MKAKFILSFFLFLMLLPAAKASDITRSFSATAVQPGGVVTVTLSVDVTGGESYYLIDETVPSGWIITIPGSGSVVQNHIKWPVYDPGSNPLPSTSYTYQVRAPAAAGIYTFSGKYVFEGMTTERVIGGENQVQVGRSLAEFSAEEVYMEMGRSMLIKIYMNNPDSQYANISLWLGGDYPRDLAKFSYDSQAYFTPDQRNFTLGLNPGESVVMRIIVYSTGLKAGGEPYLITLDANTTASTQTCSVSVKVFIDYKPQFPGLEPWGIVLALAISGLIYRRIQK